MKSSKAKLRGPAEETCGVWLDATELKQKAKKKQLTRPIYKLLNPSARSGGYGLAVALNFTQTKMEMPKTKQSNISTFFTAHRRVLNKMATSGDPNVASVERPSSPAAVTAPSSGRKRRRELCREKSDSFPAELDVAHEWESENTTARPATPQQTHPESDSSSDMCGDCAADGSEECEHPQEKKRLADLSLDRHSHCPPHTWSQDPLLTWSQFTDGQCDVPDSNSTATQGVHSLQSEQLFRKLMGVAGRTSTQRCLDRGQLSGSDDDKENSFLSSSPSKHSASGATHGRTARKGAPPQKHGNLLWRPSEKEEKLDVEWTKPTSPLRRAPCRPLSGGDDDGLAALFTQDSQGLRVIAHRGLRARSPLRDQSNAATHQSVVGEEEEEDALFTQDSQGHFVIKH